jgi:uncharacterized protein (TIGR00290 family)
MTKENIPVLLSWSGGKDSALSLYELKKTSSRPIELFTTINVKYSRVAMHGFAEQLLEKQAESLRLPLHKIYIPDPCSNEEYSQIMSEFLTGMQKRGIDTVVFGDLFLEDIRKYREENLAKQNMKALFPLWGTPTANIALKFIRDGFKAVVTCVDLNVLSKEFSGRLYDMDLLGDLPVKVDPCGENGEFHTFVFDGPIFSIPVKYEKGEQVTRYDRFCFTDLTT